MASFTQQDKRTSGNGGTTMGEAAKTAGQKIGEEAKKVKDEAKNIAGTAVHKAEDAAAFIGEKAEHATEAMGTGMKSLGGTIREKMPHEGVLGNASNAVANTLESGGQYLEQHGLKGVGDDMTKMIRQHPIPALLIGIGVGFLLARAVRS